MSTIFRRRPSAVNCFYCQSTVHASGPSFNPSFFRCPHCNCWNRYDTHGEILSDEPAMHDERLNAESFSKRATPNSNHLPTVYSSSTASAPSLFCRTCQTNQTLLVNLLSNYLPSPEDPTYSSRLASLPVYTTSLQARYPPVCDTCRPAVDEEIQRKETMARTRALGGALKETKSIARARKTELERQRKSDRRMLVWKVQAVIWALCYVFSLSMNGIGFVRHEIFSWYQSPATLLAFVALSVWSILWDPTFSLIQRSKLQGRYTRVEGRETFTRLQYVILLLRILSSLTVNCSPSSPWEACSTISMLGDRSVHFVLFVIEVTILVLSCFLIRIRQPAPVRLIDTSTSRALPLTREPSSSWSLASESTAVNSQQSSPVPAPEPDLFATLSLSNNPVITNYVANPMFGVPSLNAPGYVPGEQGVTQATIIDTDEDEDDVVLPRKPLDPDAMDWEPDVPTDHSALPRLSKPPPRDENITIRQQRFFPPEQPTGLENLLMRTRLVDSDDDGGKAGVRHGSGAKRPRTAQPWNWCWVYTLSTVPVLGLILALWATYGYPLHSSLNV